MTYVPPAEPDIWQENSATSFAPAARRRRGERDEVETRPGMAEIPARQFEEELP